MHTPQVTQNYLEGACRVESKSNQELVDERQWAVANSVESDDVFDSAQQPDGSILGESESRDKIYVIVPVERVVPRSYLPWFAAALDPTNIDGILVIFLVTILTKKKVESANMSPYSNHSFFEKAPAKTAKM